MVAEESSSLWGWSPEVTPVLKWHRAACANTQWCVATCVAKEPTKEGWIVLVSFFQF